jgi:hypothetical protein
MSMVLYMLSLKGEPRSGATTRSINASAQKQSSFSYCLSLHLRHFLRMTLPADFPDLANACRPIRFEKRCKDFGHQVVELFALHDTRKFQAFGARAYVLLPAAPPYLAP